MELSERSATFVKLSELRKIIHVDMDAFYASVEQRDAPNLKGKPVVVGGSPEGRGVVASASYEARRFGIRSAMSARRALQLCPETVFVRPQFAKYKEASQQIRNIFFEVTDLVEPLSLDEAYLDVTENKFREPTATKLAVFIRERIFTETKLTASAGVAANKFLAKLASDINKPDGLCVISPEKMHHYLEALPVEKLWGVGPATAIKLKSRGLLSTRDLRKVDAPYLVQFLGSFGSFLHGLAHGYDPRLVKPNREAKSTGSENTFAGDLTSPAEILKNIGELCDDVSSSLAKLSRRCQTITLKVRYANFRTITRSRTLSRPTDDPQLIRETATSLSQVTEIGKIPVRLLGVSLSKFCTEVEAAEADADSSRQLFLAFD